MADIFVNYVQPLRPPVGQVYIEAEDEYRAQAENVKLFYVRNNQGQSVPLSAFAEVQNRTGPEFIMHYTKYPCAQLNGSGCPGFQLGPGPLKHWKSVREKPCPRNGI